MHIGFLTPEYPHEFSTPSGGLGTSIKNLATSLISERVEVSIFIYGQSEDRKFQENGINFHFIRQKKYKLFGWYFYRKHLQQHLSKEVKKRKIDLIEAPDWTGISAFINLQCPFIIRLHGSDAYFCHLEGRKQKPKNHFFEKQALKSADSLVAVSAFTAEKSKEIFQLKKNITVITNSVNTVDFAPSEKPVIENRLLYFGTLIRKKGVLELALIFNEVIKENQEAELVLVGKDVPDIVEKTSTIEIFRKQLSPEAKENFHYISEVSYAEIREYIASAAVIVLPSFAEALPMTWLEAMAMEKALVTSNIGWAKEVMIDGKTGFTEHPKDHSAYAEKILYLLKNPSEARKMGEAAREQIISKFSTEIVVQQNIEFYRKLILPK